ncbi:F-box family protein [Prunus dulcis]|uniref:F-box family protein n=1 Tax=Prunus dulcis TaxID=3755 RepID=A0A4Y1R6T6_PRUDU|nr:F-box family protein [Prunus dulcis]
MAAKLIATSPFVGIAVFVSLIALVAFYYKPFSQQRLFTVEELALYNGTDQSLPILLGILGSVFDVTKGKSHYGEGGGYNHFSGRFVLFSNPVEFSYLNLVLETGILIALLPSHTTLAINKEMLHEHLFQETLQYFEVALGFKITLEKRDGLTDSLRDLSSTQVKSVVEWRDFYFRSYTFVGKLVGRYYDSEGNPTKYLKGVEAKAARGAQLLEKQKNEEAKQPSCNSRWSQDEGGEVWCDEGVPRLVQRPLEIALTGKMSKRCACFKEDQLDQSGLEVYEGCDFLAKTCRMILAAPL